MHGTSLSCLPSVLHVRCGFQRRLGDNITWKWHIVSTVLATYDATQHPIFSTLLELGPLGLAREAQAFGYVLKADYADKCHLCQEACQVLLSKYPAYLVPEQHYRKND